MPTVFLDGEHVNFDGPAPESLTQVQQILSDYLLNSSQVLVQLKVDGEDILEAAEGSRPSTYDTIEAFSVPQTIAIAQLLEETFEANADLSQKLINLSNEVLIQNWSFTQNALSSSISQCAQILDLLSNIIAYGANQKEDAKSWLPQAESILEAFQKHLDDLATSFEKEDIGLISELLNQSIAPLVSQCFECMHLCLATSTHHLSQN